MQPRKIEIELLTSRSFYCSNFMFRKYLWYKERNRTLSRIEAARFFLYPHFIVQNSNGPCSLTRFMTNTNGPRH